MRKPLLAVLAACAVTCLPLADGQVRKPVTLNSPEQMTPEAVAEQTRWVNSSPTFPVTLAFDGSGLPKGTTWIVNLIYATDGTSKAAAASGVPSVVATAFRGGSGQKFTATAPFPNSGTVMVQVLYGYWGDAASRRGESSRSLGFRGGEHKGIDVLVSDKPGTDNDIILVFK